MRPDTPQMVPKRNTVLISGGGSANASHSHLTLARA